MKEITLTQGMVALVDDEDYEFLMQWKWCAAKSRNTYYAQRGYSVKGKVRLVKMHRVIMKTPDNMLCDHAFHNGLDNRKFVEKNGVLKANLRNCTIAQNNMNVTGHGRSGYLGVGYTSSIVRGVRYEYIYATIRKNRKPIHIGYFKTLEDAARAYDKKASKLFGEFANLNFK